MSDLPPPPILPEIVTAYLRDLNSALEGMPDNERTEILYETRTHIGDRLQQGQSPDEALAGFGPPRTYALAFLDDYNLTHALNSKRIMTMAKALLRIATRSTVATFGLLAFITFAAITLGSAISIVLKTIRPDKVGLWVESNDHFVLGAVANPMAHELLGNYVYALFAVMILVFGYLSRFSLIAAIKSIKEQKLTNIRV